MKKSGLPDLHIHTTVSDGTDSPEAVLDAVRKAGISPFSITDHDAVKGCLSIPENRVPDDPEFITGVELSCRDELGQYHILGYGYDPSSEAILAVIRKGHALRMKKLSARLEQLRSEYGILLPEDDVSSLYSMDNPGKPHIANLMVRCGYADTKEQAMASFLNRFQFPDDYVGPSEAISGILGAGGIPVLAHPSYGNGDQLILGSEMEDRLLRLMRMGLRGLEAFYSGFTARLQAEILSLAQRHGLYVTAGSDYHGANKLVRLGETNLDPGAKIPHGLGRFLSDVRCS